jgi:hypothetical protein
MKDLSQPLQRIEGPFVCSILKSVEDLDLFRDVGPVFLGEGGMDCIAG